MDEEPDINNIIGVQFGIIGPDEIRKRSVVEVTKHDTYEKDIPIIKGIFVSRHLLSIFNVEIGFEKSTTTSDEAKLSSVIELNLSMLVIVIKFNSN